MGRALKRPDRRLDCCRHALSVQSTLEGVDGLRALFPRQYGRAPVAVMAVRPSDGKVASTPNKRNPQHHSFWSYEGIDRRTLIVEIRKVES
ncbi:MAG: hypothetical protein R3F65_20535 [bacterium]